VEEDDDVIPKRRSS